MAAPIPTTEPASLIAGDTAKWLKTLPDYPASAGWLLVYNLINAAAKITFSATASGADHLVNVAAATTSGWAAGTYAWRATVSLGGETYTIASGTISVQPAFSADTLDNRSFARMALANIEAYLRDANNLTAARYMISGRELWRLSITDQLTLRDKFRAEVTREDAAANLARGLPDKRRVMVRFGA